ncbi:MAG: hypothetical protein K2L00_08600, partial [Muribaculaceae bacterium]|nr:hypothetical protein [Muribaculaceae bacterium]
FFTAIAAVVVTGLAAQAASVSYTPQVRMNASRVGMEIIDEAPEGELTWLDRTCDGFVKKAFDATHGIVRGSVVQRVDGEDGYVYLSHMASEYPVNTWIRFEKQGDTLVMEGVQPLYVEYDYDYDEELIVYLAPMEVVVNEYNVGTFVVPEDCRYVFNIGEDGSLTSADPKMLLGVCVHTPDETVEGNDVWIWKGFGDRDISMVPASGNPVTLPEGLETYNWVMTDDYVNVFVKVAIDGDDLYVSGLDRSLPDAWVKGRIADGKAVFPSGQYLGVDMKIFYYSYFCGAEYSEETDEDGNTVQVASLTDSAVFDYDSTNGMLTLEGGYVINSTPDRIFPLYFYENVTVGEQHRNPEAAPKAPYDLEFYPDDLWGNSVFFMLPNVDVDGNILLTDNLYYEIYINGELQHFDIMDEDWNVETTVRIPYMYNDWEDFWVASDNPEDHTVYLYEDGITNIGIRSVYINENGQEIYSETAYWGDPTVGVGGLGTAPVAVKWYDLQGREINGRANGPAVKVTLFSDGSTVREKVMIK